MYPNLAYFFNSLFNNSLPQWLISILQLFNTFGLLFALSFIVAVWALGKGLSEKFAAGILKPLHRKQVVGKPASVAELAMNGVLGFLLGFKLGLLISDFSATTADFQAAIFSSKGNILVGILGAALFAYWVYAEKKKQQLPEPKEENILLKPKDWAGEIFIHAAVGGIIGAKLFHLFEYWSDFMQDPLGMLFSGSGLTFYGGVIVGAVSVAYWAIKNKVSVKIIADIIAPGLMLAYAVGRLGCQFAGDGDWGVFNTAYAVNENGKIVAAASAQDFHQTFEQHTNYFNFHFGDTTQVPHLFFKGSNLLPNWFFAYNYPHNVGNEGIAVPNCTGKYCAMLPLPVFPTPLYESFVSFLLFLLLWQWRNKLKFDGRVIALFMIFNGIERFLVELIRVNSTYSIFGIHPTQAEIISLVLVVSGAALWFAAKNSSTQNKNSA